MLDSYAIYAHVSKTSVVGYDNEATSGVGRMAKSIIRELNPVFRNKMAELPNASAADITSELTSASVKLKDDGICFFYFHGHGDSKPGVMTPDEPTDEVLVCRDRLLFDDEITNLLRLFKPTQRILSVVDSCSSETLIEWPTPRSLEFPELIHIASAKDESQAGALSSGGIFSNRMLTIISNFAFFGLTYQTFTTRLQLFTVNAPCIVRKSDNVTQSFLNKRLFT